MTSNVNNGPQISAAVNSSPPVSMTAAASAQAPAATESKAEAVNEAPAKKAGVYTVKDITFTEFEDGYGKGVSAEALIASGDDETHYSAGLYYGCDDTGWVIIADETPDGIRQRLKDIINKEISNPLTSRLIDHRF